MKKFLGLIIGILCSIFCYSQSYDQANRDLANYLRRMYSNSPFDGVKVFTDYENTYLLSVVSLIPDKYQNQAAMNRVASVKASSQASKFFNGSKITSEAIIRTYERPDKEMETSIEETINENSTGYVSMLELITAFDSDNNRVFIYGRKIDTPQNTQKSKKDKKRK